MMLLTEQMQKNSNLHCYSTQSFLTDKVPYFLFPRGILRIKFFLYGILRSICLDWYARRFVETGLKLYIIKTLPVPRPPDNDSLRLRLIEIAGRLACVDDRFANLALQLGVECGPIDPEARLKLIWELDGVVGNLYNLSAVDMRHVFESFHDNWDYASDLKETLFYFNYWNKS